MGIITKQKISAVIEDVTDINISEIVVSNNLLTTNQYDINKLKIHTDSAYLVDTVIKIDYFEWSIFHIPTEKLNLQNTTGQHN